MQTVSIKQIQPDENQPRKYFNAEKMKNLSNSIRQHGIVNPLIVQEVGKGQYLLVDGERRFRAATQIGLKEVPVIVEKPQKGVDRLVRQFNIQEQHESWTPAEKAVAVSKLAEEMGISLPAVCKLLNVTEGDTRRYVAFAQLVDKEGYLKNEIPLDYASGIASVRNLAKRLYMSDLEKEFTSADAKKIEHRIIESIKTGAVERRSDLSRLKDAFTKNPKSVQEFMNSSKVTPTSLYLSTKAKGAYHLRNTIRNAQYATAHAREFQKLRDVKVTDEQVRILKTAIGELNSIINLAE